MGVPPARTAPRRSISFVRGLADAAGDRHDPRRRRARARRRPSAASPASVSSTRSSAASWRHGRGSRSTIAPAAPRSSASATKSCPSRSVPQRHEQVARLHRAAVDASRRSPRRRRAACRRWPRAARRRPRAARSSRDPCQAPHHRGVVEGHASRRRPSARSRAPCRPPPARRPAAARPRRRRSRPRGRRSRSRRDRRRASPARIAAGSSLRGLSSVTTARSASRGADRAHQRPLAGVAVAAGAEHHVQPPAGPACGRSAVQQPFQRVGRVGVVDIDAGAVRAGAPPAPSGRARRAAPAAPPAPARPASPVVHRQRRGQQHVVRLVPAGQHAAAPWRAAPQASTSISCPSGSARGAAAAPLLRARPPSHAAGRARAAVSREAHQRRGSMSAFSDGRAAGRAAAPRTAAASRRGRPAILAMVVQVVAREVGEAGAGERDAVQPSLVQPVRGCLHRRCAHARFRAARRASRAATPGRVWSGPVPAESPPPPGPACPATPRCCPPAARSGAGTRPCWSCRWCRSPRPRWLAGRRGRRAATSASARRASGAVAAGEPARLGGHIVPSGASTAAAPRDTASAIWSRPSVRAPGSAANRKPGSTRRLSAVSPVMAERRAVAGREESRAPEAT